ncbi:MAG: TAXI family TRAP transporter solute-binding subunit [Verrucomicrobiota bacterium]
MESSAKVEAKADGVIDRGGLAYAVLTVLLGVLALAIVAGAWMSRKKVHQLVLYSGQKGGIYLEVADEIARQLSEGNRGIEVEVRTTAGSVENLRAVASDANGRSLAIVQNDVFLEGLAANGVRSVLPLHEGILHFIVPASSEVYSVSDLRGTTIAGGRKGSGTPRLLASLLDHYGLSGEIEVHELGVSEACEALQSGEVDAFVMAMGLKSPALETLLEKGDYRFVGIGASIGPGSEIEGFRLTYPFVGSTMIPRFTYQAPGEETKGIPRESKPAISIRAILVANESLRDEHGRLIAEVLIENRSALAQGHPSTAQITEDFDPGQLQFPIHRGSYRYLHRHDPGFLRQNAELFGFLLSLVLALTGFTISMRKWVNHRKKDRIDGFYIQLDNLLADLRGSDHTMKELEEMDEDLWRMNREAVRQLAAEKLIANDSFRIFQSSLSEGRNELRRRMEKCERLGEETG